MITSSDNPIYVISSDTNIAVTTVNNRTVSVTGVTYGKAIITVMQENISNSKEFLCIVSRVGTNLTSTSWEIISEISQAGIGDSYWDIGDVKSITLNGTIGDGLILNNFVTNVFILHFNYPINGVADNNIIWGGFKDNKGKDIALIDSEYFQQITDVTMYFNMNRQESVNYGGWKGCDLRYDILGATSTPPSDYGKIHTTACVGYDATSATLANPKTDTLLAALSSDFRNSLRLWSRWINAVGSGSNSDVDANIEGTIDAITLLAEFEVQGVRNYANQYEQNYQSQMEYYRLGNSRIKYKYNNFFSSAEWRFASLYSYLHGNFHYVKTNGYLILSSAYYSSAVVPAFKT